VFLFVNTFFEKKVVFFGKWRVLCFDVKQDELWLGFCAFRWAGRMEARRILSLVFLFAWNMGRISIRVRILYISLWLADRKSVGDRRPQTLFLSDWG